MIEGDKAFNIIIPSPNTPKEKGGQNLLYSAP